MTQSVNQSLIKFYFIYFLSFFISPISYTTYQLRSLLDKRKDSVLAKLRSIERPTNNDTNAYEIILTLLLFIQSFVRSNLVTKNERSFVCTESDLVKILQFKRSPIDDAIEISTALHPLLVLKTHLSDRLTHIDLSADEKSHIEEIVFNLNNVLKILDIGIASISMIANTNSDSVQNSPAPEPSFLQCDGIVAQFSQRTLYTIVSDEIVPNTNYAEQLTTAYWCAKSSPNRFVDDETVQSMQSCDTVPCDLIEMMKTCLPPDTNLSSDCKRLLHLSASPQSNRERTTSAPCFRTRRVEVEPSTGRPEKKIYSRGRGFSRAPPSLFRSRQPNTSRPPSLHVDDFTALETCGAQPTGPTGYNKLAREIISIRGTRGGRGRGRILSISSSGSPYRHSS